ncbi:hypothetical protein EUX98_g805 [Antrodiella citrinella]|uniref:acylaminoacyl-peptidase n=1 Tax=Antrodiella citrinella TaxID=2447956 RepID=A0A4S4N2Z5_9APHY|nr:hypothetical protein EUX98_g805 [Antrodiella citrinella]
MADPLDVFLELARVPIYASAQFQSKNVLRVLSRFRDFDRDCYRASTTTYVVAGDAVFSTFAPDSSNIVLSTVSPSGKRLAAFREANEAGATKRFVEIWVDNKLEASLEVTKLHEAFYNDDIFSLVSFSPEEDVLVYTAEDKASDDKGIKYDFVPPLGEGYPGKKSPGLYLFKWGTGKPSAKALRPTSSLVGPLLFTQPVFSSKDQLLVIGYAYTEDHKLLGVKHCPNRIAGVYSISLPPEISKDESDIQCSFAGLTSPDISCRCPRVLHTNGASSLLVYIANSVGGPHASCSTLHVVELATGKAVATVSVVEDPKDGEFPGLYTVTLPADPFLVVDGEAYVVSNSVWRSRSTVILVRLKDGNVTELTSDDGKLYSWMVLATDGGSQLTCTRSSLTSPPELLLGRIGSDLQANWTTILKSTLSVELQTRVASLDLSVIPVKDRYPTETIVLRGKDKQTPLPSVNLIHGGPHGSSTTAFSPVGIALALEGYVVSAPNYTGSVGYGDKYVRKLLGNIGDIEVKDCLQAALLLKHMGIAGDELFLSGGSHGGFILAHLLGQYPVTFKAASIGNPVIHLGDVSGTDIPDWYYEESGFKYTPTSLVTPDMYAKLYKMSPINYVDQVSSDVPILLNIGEKDARVANAQGKAYYHALKGRKKDIKMLTFKEDNHSLDSVEASRAVFKATRELFARARK